jgi:polyphosphate kinase 2 (PPK2 family)
LLVADDNDAVRTAFDWGGIRFDGTKRFGRAEAKTRIDDLYRSKKDYEKKLRKLRRKIDKRQRVMYAHDRYSLLAIFQAMDAAGKDGTIRRHQRPLTVALSSMFATLPPCLEPVWPSGF